MRGLLAILAFSLLVGVALSSPVLVGEVKHAEDPRNSTEPEGPKVDAPPAVGAKVRRQAVGPVETPDAAANKTADTKEEVPPTPVDATHHRGARQVAEVENTNATETKPKEEPTPAVPARTARQAAETKPSEEPKAANATEPDTEPKPAETKPSRTARQAVPKPEEKPKTGDENATRTDEVPPTEPKPPGTRTTRQVAEEAPKANATEPKTPAEVLDRTARQVVDPTPVEAPKTADNATTHTDEKPTPPKARRQAPVAEEKVGEDKQNETVPTPPISRPARQVAEEAPKTETKGEEAQPDTPPKTVTPTTVELSRPVRQAPAPSTGEAPAPSTGEAPATGTGEAPAEGGAAAAEKSPTGETQAAEPAEPAEPAEAAEAA